MRERNKKVVKEQNKTKQNKKTGPEKKEELSAIENCYKRFFYYTKQRMR